MILWLELLLCLSIIGYAGYFLSRYGDIIAEKSGVSASWVGLILLATATSLPELVTGISAVTLAGAPNIAVGDVLGSTVFNLAILVMLDALYRRETLYSRAAQGHILSASPGAILFTVLTLSQMGHVLAIRKEKESLFSAAGAFFLSAADFCRAADFRAANGDDLPARA